MKYELAGKESKKGVSCFKLVMTMTTEVGGQTMFYEHIMWVNENDLCCACVWIEASSVIGSTRMPLYEGPCTSEYSAPEVPDYEFSIGVETITVPAGTFTCEKLVIESEGTTINRWCNRDLPIYGLVKVTVYEGAVLRSEMELLDYNG